MPLPWRRTRGACVVVIASLLSSSISAQVAPPPPPPNQQQNPPRPQNTVADPGARSGGADAGGPLSGLSSAEWNFFSAASRVFQEVDSVSGTLAGEDGRGLGPRFNSNSCAGCHTYPSVGGTSPARNPQIADRKSTRLNSSHT